MVQGEAHSVHFLTDPSVFWAPTMRTIFQASNDHALCCMLNHGNTLVQLLHCLSLSSCQLESALPPSAQLLLSQSQQGDLIGHHLRLSNVFERISRPSEEPFYATNTSHRKQKYFFMDILCIEFFCSQRMHNRICHEAGLCCYLVMHIKTY
jgi:hypothetical protein